MINFKKKKKPISGARMDTKEASSRTQLKESLDIIRDFLARQEQRYDSLGSELQAMENQMEALTNAYRSKQADLRPVEEESQLLEISRLRQQIEHLKDLRYRLLESMNSFQNMEREIEISLDSERVVSIADRLNPMALQELVTDIDINYRHTMVSYTPVLQPAASSVFPKLANLKEDLLRTPGKQDHDTARTVQQAADKLAASPINSSYEKSRE